MKYKTALIFGAFDPLHFGHIRLFKRAKNIAYKVYACTEADEIIRRDKKREPFTNENDRVADLKGIRYLSGVAIRTDIKDRGHWAKKFKADVLILGDDWKGKKWEGLKLKLPVVYFPYTNQISSTIIRNGVGIPKD